MMMIKKRAITNAYNAADTKLNSLPPSSLSDVQHSGWQYQNPPNATNKMMMKIMKRIIAKVVPEHPDCLWSAFL